MTKPPHLPVLYQETIQAINPRSPGRYVDGTVGAGGHAAAVLEASAPEGEMLGLDVDPQALEIASARLAPFGSRVTLVQAHFSTFPEVLSRKGWDVIQGILLDLGVSSMQLDSPERGFSFQQDGPLDMRLDPRQEETAADLVNGLPEDELADILWRYGDERRSRQIARAICRARPFSSTLELAETVRRAAGAHGAGRIHPATRTFQALRIAVNCELEALETTLPLAVDALAAGGRLAVISFHSLEDRIVKHFLRRESQDCICPGEQPVCTCSHRATLKLLSRSAIKPQKGEISNNSRARSARLRFAEKRSPPSRGADLAQVLH